MSQMSGVPQMLSPQQNLVMQQEIAMQQASVAAVNVNGSPNPTNLLNGCTTLVTNTNINVTYLNGAIANKYDHKMHQGFIAVLKVH